MNNKLKTLIGLILYLTIPVLMAYVVAKAVADHNGKLLLTFFIILLVLEIIVVINKIISFKKNK